jgi:hypothetical protein
MNLVALQRKQRAKPVIVVLTIFCVLYFNRHGGQNALAETGY